LVGDDVEVAVVEAGQGQGRGDAGGVDAGQALEVGEQGGIERLLGRAAGVAGGGKREACCLSS
jgi:hypothetical protein